MNISGSGRDAARNWVLAVLLALTLPMAVISVNAIVIIVAIMALWFAVIRVYRRSLPEIEQRGLVLIVVLLLVWSVCSLAWSIDPALTWSRLARLAAGLAAGWLALALMAEQAAVEGAAGRLADALAVALAASAAFVIAHALSGGSLMEWLALRRPHPDTLIALSGTNNAAVMLAVWLLPSLILIRRRRGNAVALALFALGAGAIFLSESSAAKLALLAAMAAFAIAAMGKFAAALLTAAIGIVTFALPLLAWIEERPFAALRSLFEQAGLALPETALHRVCIYDFVLEKIWARPLTGWGLGTSRRLPGGEVKIAALERELLPMHPHNAAFELWVELGVGGGALLAAIAIMVATVAIRRAAAPARAAAMAALTAYLCIGMLNYSAWSSWWLAAAFLSACPVLALALSSRPE